MTEALAKINNLITVITSWFTAFYDLFFSATPGNVTIKKLGTDGTVEDVSVPNLAKHRESVLSASGTINMSASHVGDAGGPAWVEMEPEIPEDMNANIGLVQYEIELFQFTEGTDFTLKYLHATISAVVAFTTSGSVYAIDEENSKIHSGDGNWALSCNDTPGTLAGAVTLPRRLRIFVRNELNLDPDYTSYFKARVRKTQVVEF